MGGTRRAGRWAEGGAGGRSVQSVAASMARLLSRRVVGLSGAAVVRQRAEGEVGGRLISVKLWAGLVRGKADAYDLKSTTTWREVER